MDSRRLPWPSSLRSRLTLWYTALLAVPLIVFAIACYVVVAQTLERRTDLFIGDALTAFSRELTAERRAAWTPIDAMRSTVAEVRFRDLRIAILDSGAIVVAMNARDDADPRTNRHPSADDEQRLLSELRTRDLARPQELTIALASGAFRVMSQPLRIDGQQFTLTGAYAMRDIADVLERVRRIFLVAIPLLLLCAATGGYVLAKRSLAPVAAMTARAAEISASTLHERLPVGGGDELVSLASVVNGLLDRLQQSFDRQRQFVTDASHELRTPTAVVRTEADVTLAREHRTESEYRASVSIIQDAARRLTRIVDDLFLLARADSGHLVMRRDAVYLEELVHDATRAVRSVASQRGVDISIGACLEAPISGDADLLGRVLLNLLDNAIKYSPARGVVQVEMSRVAHGFAVSITDEGPGVPREAHARVFERFFRADTARSRSETSSTSGAGLGLAIGRRIAEMHAGSLTLVESRPGRTEFRLVLPSDGR